MKISIAMATYNGESYIREQIESFLIQSIMPDEIVICDDNSNDCTVQIARSILNDSGISFFIIQHNTNQGILKTFEDAVRHTTGNYVFFADQDDVWLNKKIEIMLKNIINANALIAFSNAHIVDEKLNKLGKTQWETIKYNIQNEQSKIFFRGTLLNELLKRNVVTGMTMVAQRDFLLSILPFPSAMMHDAWIALMATIYGNVLALNECLVLYRQHSNNMIGSGSRDSMSKLKKAYHNYGRILYGQYEKCNIIEARLFQLSTKQTYFINMKKFLKRRVLLMERKLPYRTLWNRDFIVNYNTFFVNGRRYWIKDVLMNTLSRIKGRYYG